MIKLFMVMVVLVGAGSGGASSPQPLLVGEFPNENECRRAAQASIDPQNLVRSPDTKVAVSFLCVRAR